MKGLGLVTNFLILTAELFVKVKETNSFRAPSFATRQSIPQRTRSNVRSALTRRYLTTDVFMSPFFDMNPVFSVEQPALFCTMYWLAANMVYLLRRSCIRNMSTTKLLQIRLARENGVTIPLYFTNLLVWQIFVNFLFPMLEPTSRLFGYVSFYYFYPNASGMGIIFEPVAVQGLHMNKRAKHQIRLDWHRFSVNVGPPGRDGFRHPPSVERNMPHLDVPKLGWKHWPWRRKHHV